MATEGSVWLEQVDTALLDYIDSIVKVTVGTTVTDVPVVIKTPESEFQAESFPCVSFFNFDIRNDFARNPATMDFEYISHDNDTHKSTFSKGSIAYVLYYQIDFWAKYQTDINEMIMKWLSNVPAFHSIEVENTLTVDEVIWMTQLGSMQNLDFVEDDQRFFRRSISYKFRVNLDERADVELDGVNEIIITD